MTTIGVRLFDRNSLGVEPTIYGQALLKRGIAAFDELKQGLRDLEYLANLLTMGGFLTAMPKSLLRFYPDLKPLHIVLPPHEYPVAIVTLTNRTLSPVVELFLDRLRRFIKSEVMTRSEM